MKKKLIAGFLIICLSFLPVLDSMILDYRINVIMKELRAKSTGSKYLVKSSSFRE